MVHIRTADAGPGVRNIPVVLQDMSFHASTYTLIRFHCDDGQSITVTGGGGSESLGFYSAVANFTALRPDTRYGFRVETIYNGGHRWTPLSNWTYFRTLPDTTSQPGRPTVTEWSVNGRSITWRITPGANTTRIDIDRDWVQGYPDDTRSTSGTPFNYTQTVPYYNTRYGIDIRGYNSSYGEGVWSGFTHSTSGPEPITVGNVTGLYSTIVSTSGFRLNWSSATNATRYQIRMRKEGTSTWTTDTTTSSTFHTFSNLDAVTYYEMQVRGYQDSTYGNWSSVFRVRTEDNKPTPLNWPTFVSGNDFTLTAVQWNSLASKINGWRDYKGWNSVTIATAVRDNELKATMFNEMVDYLNGLSTPIPPPQKVSRGTIVTAARINGLGNAIDSL